jgi:hypothetical protein
MSCIRAHETRGDYTERSHPWDGSGAYQFIPTTWRYWAQRAGHGTWRYAYEAPSRVQDAVAAFTLEHGGGGAWSMRFGDDPCTGM